MRLSSSLASVILVVACGHSSNDDIASTVQQCELDDANVCSNFPFGTTTASADVANPMPIDAGIRYYIDGPGAGQRGYVVFTPVQSGTHTLYFGDAEPLRVCNEEALCSSAVTSCGDLHRAAQYAFVEGDPYVIELKPIAAGHPFVLKIVAPAAPPPPPPPPGSPKLAAPVFYASTGGVARDMSVGDLNADNRIDVVLSNPDDAGGDNHVEVLRNNGSGAFASAAIIQTSAPRETRIADFDGDGDADIAGIASDGMGPLPNFLLKNAGNFTFTKSTWTPALQYRGTLSSGDFDEDGISDVVAAYTPESNTNPDSGFVIHEMPGAAVLQQVAEFGPSTSSAIAGDFNGDGHQDVIVGSSAAPRVRLYLGNGSGTVSYDREITLPVSQRITKLVALNVDANGYTDFAAFGAGPEGYGTESMSITTPSATGYATQALQFAAYGVAAGDFDHDGRIDLITGVPDASDGPYLSFYRGTANGFVFVENLANGSYSSTAQMAGVDVNNDGFADLIVGHANGIRVYLGTP